MDMGDMMEMWTFFSDVAVKWGLPALVLIFWYLDSRDQKKLFQAMLTQQQQQADQHFAQTQQMLETLQWLGSGQARIENKMDTNQSCPVVRRERHNP